MVGFSAVSGKVVGVTPDQKGITIQLDFSPYSGPSFSLIGGNLEVKTQLFNQNLGALYANTIEGTEVKQFYTDTAFTQKWIPPVADRFYVFQTIKNYNPQGITFPPSGPLKYSEYPYYCAKFNSTGKMVEQLSPSFDVQTAWVGQNMFNTNVLPIANYSYNVLYDPSI